MIRHSEFTKEVIILYTIFLGKTKIQMLPDMKQQRNSREEIQIVTDETEFEQSRIGKGKEGYEEIVVKRK